MACLERGLGDGVPTRALQRLDAAPGIADRARTGAASSSCGQKEAVQGVEPCFSSLAQAW